MAKRALKLVESKPLTAVQARTANSAVSLPENYNDDVKWLEDLRGELWGRGGAINGSWKEVAKSINLAPSTVSKFATGVTKKPSIHTVRRIAEAFGYFMTFVKRKPSRGNGAISQKRASLSD